MSWTCEFARSARPLARPEQRRRALQVISRLEVPADCSGQTGKMLAGNTIKCCENGGLVDTGGWLDTGQRPGEESQAFGPRQSHQPVPVLKTPKRGVERADFAE